MKKELEQEIIQRVRELSEVEIQEVLDFIEFLRQRQQKREWVSFDQWAMNLSRERGFSHLTEEDVARIIDMHRQKRA